MRINLPNRITLSRLLLAIVFFVLLAQYSVQAPRVWLADVCIGLFIVAAATDALDGYLARKHNQVTAVGRILDPFVDKVLVCGTFVFLAGPAFADARGVQTTCVAPWMVVLILGRELLVTGLRGFSESRGHSFGASGAGKAKMIVQSVTAPTIMFLVAHPGGIPLGRHLAWVKPGLIWLTVAVTAFSLIGYLLKSRRILAEGDSA